MQDSDGVIPLETVAWDWVEHSQDWLEQKQLDCMNVCRDVCIYIHIRSESHIRIHISLAQAFSGLLLCMFAFI